MSGLWLPSVLSGIFGIGGAFLGIWLTDRSESRRWRQDVEFKQKTAWSELQQKTALDAQSAARQHWQAVVSIYRGLERGEDPAGEWGRCADAGSQVTTFACLLDNVELRTDLSKWTREVQTHVEAALEDQGEPITYEWMKARVEELRKLNERLSGDVREMQKERIASLESGE